MSEGISKNTMLEVAGAIVAALIGAGLFHSCQSSDGGNSQPTISAPVSTQASSTPISLPSSTPPPDTATTPVAPDNGDDDGAPANPPAQPAQPKRQYLSDREPTSPFDYKTGAATVGGTVYSHSVWSPLRSCEPDGHKVTYDIETDWKTFSAWIGLNNKSDDTYVVSFQVYLDGVPYGDDTEKSFYGKATKVTIPVAGKQRITLAQASMRGGQCNDSDHLGYATWGNAELER